MLVDSSFFRACKQTRAEGLNLFYQHHTFILSVQHANCFIAIHRWLENIGNIGRDNIRHLTIRVNTMCAWSDAWTKENVKYRIHQKLTDHATVVYTGTMAGYLLMVGRHLCHGNPVKAPVYMIDGKPLEPHWWKSNYDFDQSLHDNQHWTEYSLAFYPGNGWFGSCK